MEWAGKDTQKNRNRKRNIASNREGIICWNCRGPHFKYNCPFLPREHLEYYRTKKRLFDELENGVREKKFFYKLVRDALHGDTAHRMFFKELMREVVNEELNGGKDLDVECDLNAEKKPPLPALSVPQSNLASECTPPHVFLPTSTDYPPFSGLTVVPVPSVSTIPLTAAVNSDSETSTVESDTGRRRKRRKRNKKVKKRQKDDDSKCTPTADVVESIVSALATQEDPPLTISLSTLNSDTPIEVYHLAFRFDCSDVSEEIGWYSSFCCGSLCAE